jgi:glycerol-3-phosphate dehydrogenase
MGEQLQKNSVTSFDFFIVGQGITGSILSLSLIEAGFSVCVIDNSKLSSCY